MFGIANMALETSEGAGMPYREKIAWLSLAAMALGYGPYFAWVAIEQPPPDVPNLPLLALFAAATAVRLAVLGPVWLWLRLKTPADDRMEDERDRDIQRRAVTWAYYVLMIGALLGGAIQPFTTYGWDIVNAMLWAVVIGEAVRDALVIRGYRRPA